MRGVASGARSPVPVLAAAATLALAGCELDEVSIVEVEPVVVAEVFANLAPSPVPNEIFAFLHYTIGTGSSPLPPLDDATITIRRETAGSFELVPSPVGLGACFGGPLPPGAESTASCHVAQHADASAIVPGELLSVDIRLPGGGLLFGAAEVPGGFAIADALRSGCRVLPESLYTVTWTRSEGAWAYVNETRIWGLPRTLPDSIDAPEPLDLLGLSISAEDTTIVFPSEFGVFDRFELDQDLAVVLQDGLPETVTADVIITATDRNFVNWVRGGNFNPSGQVRVPSLRGDGTGVFGATFRQGFSLFVSSDTRAGAPCPA